MKQILQQVFRSGQGRPNRHLEEGPALLRPLSEHMQNKFQQAGHEVNKTTISPANRRAEPIFNPRRPKPQRLTKRRLGNTIFKQVNITTLCFSWLIKFLVCVTGFWSLVPAHTGTKQESWATPGAMEITVWARCENGRALFSSKRWLFGVSELW